MTDAKKRILLTNDDGIDAPGLRTLLGPLGEIGDLVVVAPAVECSGVSSSIIYRRPVVCEKRELPHGVPGYAVDAFPVDCVKLALDKILDEPPDLVVSGINPGANISTHLYYSGTVAAAMEAALLGVPSMAVSLEVAKSGEKDFERAVRIFLDVYRSLDRLELGPSSVMNINIPTHEKKLLGVRWAVQSPEAMPDTYDGPEGEGHRRTYQMRSLAKKFDLDHVADDDCSLLNAGYVTVTPLRCDLTCHDTIARLHRTGKLELTGD